MHLERNAVDYFVQSLSRDGMSCHHQEHEGHTQHISINLQLELLHLLHLKIYTLKYIKPHKMLLYYFLLFLLCVATGS